MGSPTTVRVAIAGSTGSIGTQTLDVVRAENARPDRDVEYVVAALGVGSSVDVLIAQAREFRVGVVAVADSSRVAEVRDALPGVRVESTMSDLVAHADVVVNAVVGFAGLDVTLATLAAGDQVYGVAVLEAQREEVVGVLLLARHLGCGEHAGHVDLFGEVSGVRQDHAAAQLR